MTLLVASSGYEWARLGISISRRFGNAVKRNRMKRLIRESFRALRHNWPPHTDWVVIPKTRAEAPTLEQVRNSLDALRLRLTQRIKQFKT